jgi:Na+-driven multidrug efflux pump
MVLGAITIMIAVVAGIIMSNKYSDKPRSRSANNALATVLFVIGVIVVIVLVLGHAILRPIGQV